MTSITDTQAIQDTGFRPITMGPLFLNFLLTQMMLPIFLLM